LCEACYQSGAAQKHPHPLRSNKQNKSSQDTQMLALLDHSSACVDAQCPQHNCLRMKALLNHSPECPVRLSGGCQNCVRFWRLLSLHAKQCHALPGTCKVMHCDKLKLHLRQKQNNSADRRMTAVMNRDTGAAPQQPAAEAAPQPQELPPRGKKRGKGE